MYERNVPNKIDVVSFACLQFYFLFTNNVWLYPCHEDKKQHCVHDTDPIGYVHFEREEIKDEEDKPCAYSQINVFTPCRESQHTIDISFVGTERSVDWLNIWVGLH